MKTGTKGQWDQGTKGQRDEGTKWQNLPLFRLVLPSLRPFLSSSLRPFVTSSLLLASCGPLHVGGSSTASEQNDLLRREVQQLERDKIELEKELENRLAQVKVLQQEMGNPVDGESDDAAERPMLSGLDFARYSGPVDTDNDGNDDELRLYLRTVDQQGRMMPVAASARVRVVAVPLEGEPRVVMEKSYTPAELDGLFRSSFTGDYYSLEIDLPDPLPVASKKVLAKVFLTQTHTGRELEVEHPFAIRHLALDRR